MNSNRLTSEDKKQIFNLLSRMGFMAVILSFIGDEFFESYYFWNWDWYWGVGYLILIIVVGLMYLEEISGIDKFTNQ